MKMHDQHDYCKEEKEPPRLYKIGMFANMNHVTIKTLRYYDEQGLLKPAHVEVENGYRYYSYICPQFLTFYCAFELLY